jgi:hypothetical protein
MIYAKQNDTRPAAPAILKRGTTVVDLTLATTVTFKMRRLGKIELKVDNTAYVVSAVAGSVEYRWAEGDTDAAGEYLAEWEVLWDDDTVETFPTVDYDVVLISSDLDGST